MTWCDFVVGVVVVVAVVVAAIVVAGVVVCQLPVPRLLACWQRNAGRVSGCFCFRGVELLPTRLPPP